jgi:hypothetical protein
MVQSPAFILESRIFFAFPRVIELFLRSEAPGLVFSEEKDSGLPPPPKGDGIFDTHFRKAPRPSYS